MSATARRQREPWDDWVASEERGQPVRVVTPGRVVLFLAVLIAAGIAAYGLFLDRSLLQIPITVSGLAMLGIALGLLGFSAAGAATGLGREGRTGPAVLVAFIGGLCALAAAGALGAALVLGILIMAG
jgi:hypothetical protein